MAVFLLAIEKLHMNTYTLTDTKTWDTVFRPKIPTFYSAVDL